MKIVYRGLVKIYFMRSLTLTSNGEIEFVSGDTTKNFDTSGSFQTDDNLYCSIILGNNTYISMEYDVSFNREVSTKKREFKNINGIIYQNVDGVQTIWNKICCVQYDSDDGYCPSFNVLFK